MTSGKAEYADRLANVLSDILESCLGGNPSDDLLDSAWATWAEYFQQFQDQGNLDERLVSARETFYELWPKETNNT